MKTEMETMANDSLHIETPCIAHEEQIQELSRKTAELEAKNGFKAQRINELIENAVELRAKC